MVSPGEAAEKLFVGKDLYQGTSLEAAEKHNFLSFRHEVEESLLCRGFIGCAPVNL